jgi:peptidoglycan/LPS O-acetylase OafA/YrhL
LFPAIVYLGASGELKGTFSTKVNRFLGDISYPLYIIHYPFIYLFMAWVAKYKVTLTGSLPMAFAVLVFVIVLAYGFVKLYDVPVRRWLAEHFMKKGVKTRSKLQATSSK